MIVAILPKINADTIAPITIKIAAIMVWSKLVGNSSFPVIVKMA